MALKIAIVVVGALRRDTIREAIEDYIKRIGRYNPVELIKVKPWKGAASATEALEREAQRLCRVIQREDLLVVLDEAGKEPTTEEFARWLDGVISYPQGKRRLCFVVGGSFGLSSTIKQGAERIMALSKMTLAYELATLVLVEQIYRAFTIIRGEPYSH